MTPAEMAALHARAFDWPRPWRSAEFADLLSHSGCFACGDFRAFALVRVTLDEAELLTIATDPDLRRQGRARALMTAWHEEARKRGATQAFLEVAADNQAAIALYQGHGYVKSGVRRGYYRKQDGSLADAIVMTCAL